jgi:transposase
MWQPRDFFYSLNAPCSAAGAELPPTAACTTTRHTAALPPVRCSILIMIEVSPSAYPSGMLAVGKSRFTKEGGDLRRGYTNPHKFYGGIDLHTRAMDVGIVSHDGEILLHRHRQAAPEPFLKAVAPSREGLVVAVEGLFTWSWLADLCAEQAIPFVLGHALYMQAIHGGKANNDTIDAHKIAALLRGGMLPQAYVDPAERRATRDLLRRRTHLRRKRTERLSHVQNTNAPDNLPDLAKKIAYQANREGVAERFHDPAVQKTIEVDLALITYDDELLRDLERSIVKTAKQPDAHTLYLLQTVPGIGKILSLVLLYEIHDIGRFPSVQDFASYARLVKCSKESAGKRLGTSGKKIGNAHLKWAFSEAATLFLRNNPNGQKLLARLEKKHGKGKALTSLAHKLARAVYDMLKRKTAFDMDSFLRT